MGLQKKLKIGNINSKRDWGHAKDYVEAMWLMLQKKVPKDYVIATGESHSIRDFLDVAFNCVGIDDWSNYVVQDERFMRPAEIDVLCGDSSKARKQLGWSPKTSFEEMVRKMVNRDISLLSDD